MKPEPGVHGLPARAPSSRPVTTSPVVRKPARGGPAGARRRILLLKTAIWLTGLGPVAWLVAGFFRGTLGVLPVDTIILVEGRWTLVFLLATLAVTPVRRLTGWNRIIQVRRLLGLFAFFHACVHFLAYAGIDQLFALGYILEDVRDRRYITAGFAALVLLIPLAATSTKGWIRRLGKRWLKLHRLVYVSASLGVLHFYWKVRADTFWPLVAALTLAGLFAVRVVYRARRPKSLPLAALALCLGASHLAARQQDIGDTWITHPEFEIGEGATGAGPAAFGRIGSIRVIGDTLVLVADPLDFRTTIWTPEGRLVAQVGGPGEGPGEFSGSFSPQVHRDGFHVIDARRFTSFSNAGELLGTTPFPPPSLDYHGYGLGPRALLEDGSVLAIPRVSPVSLMGLWGDPPIRMLPVLRLADADGRWQMDTIAMLDQRNRALLIAREGAPRQAGIQSAQMFGDYDLTWFDPVAGSVVVARRNLGGGDVELLEIRADGDTAWQRRIATPPVSLTREQVDGTIDNLARQLAQQTPLATMRDAVREALYIPDPLPGARSVHGTASGEVWFRPDSRPAPPRLAFGRPRDVPPDVATR